MSIDLSKDVNVEALPVVPQFLKQNENGGVRCEVIKIEEYDGKQAVNARELHQKLGSKYQFANWIQERISKYGFVENQDYEVFKGNLKNSNGGRSRIEYALSLDMAKELCMVENNDAGRRIRKYFIDMENEARKLMLQQSAVPSYQEVDPIKRATRWIEEEKERQALMLENKRKQEALEASQREVVELSSTITQMQPKVSYVDSILQSKSTVTVTSIAQDYGETARKFNLILRDLKIQHKVGSQWIVYRDYLKDGYVQSKTFDYVHKDGSLGVGLNTVWTQKGRLFLYEFLKSKGILPLIEQQNSNVAQN